MPCLQTESVQSVVDILGCSKSTARVLLTFFRWDTEALFGALAERGPEWVYKAASVTSRSDTAPSPKGLLSNLTVLLKFCAGTPFAGTAVYIWHLSSASWSC